MTREAVAARRWRNQHTVAADAATTTRRNRTTMNSSSSRTVDGYAWRQALTLVPFEQREAAAAGAIAVRDTDGAVLYPAGGFGSLSAAMEVGSGQDLADHIDKLALDDAGEERALGDDDLSSASADLANYIDAQGDGDE